MSVVHNFKKRINDEWNLPSSLCPCLEPNYPVPFKLRNWKEYFQWRCLPLDSPVALLLHWPLTVYHCLKLLSSINKLPGVGGSIHIHYLGPGRELHQLAVFGELAALLPGFSLHIEFIGPEIPEIRNNDKMTICKYARCLEEDCACKTTNLSSSLILHLRKGFYHDRFPEVVKVSSPHIVIAPNAGLAAYSSWLPTIELIHRIGVPAFFSDFCEEAADLGASCIEKSTGKPLTVPVQVNPFRQPMPVEDSALCLPCYSNCFIFGL